ncbi:MAG: glutamine-synthetase adenylyltransferase, partial [Alphaproteobacteria bacterium]|nr:glutamine-synthetase adenylyltransferase [Alphaproteobacteria bacterium]
HHPGTLETLADLGFSEPETASTIVRNWHRGRYRAMRSTRARELLTELGPALLTAIARGVDPDQALRRFDAFLAGLPAGVQLFSLLHANPVLHDLLTEIMGSAPRLADTAARNPLILDHVLSADFFDPPPDFARLRGALAERLDQARDVEDQLIAARRWSNDAKFQVGVQSLRNLIDVTRAGEALSDIADTAIVEFTSRIAQDFARSHGVFAHAQFAVLSMGKLGARELTEGSDLDLVFIYDIPGGNSQSDGQKPLAPGHYYQRFTQRLVTALTAPTGDGKLYEVDLRLRPSGKSGPVSVTFETFANYQKDGAWTWEQMALTRARIVTAPPGLSAKIEAVIAETLTQPRERLALKTDVAEMRARIEAEHATTDPWHVKHVPGGLVDCEFIAQYLQLAHGAKHRQILSPATRSVFEAAAAAELIDEATAQDLIDATLLWRRLQSMIRLCLASRESTERGDNFPTALKNRLTDAEDVGSFAELEARMADVRTRTRAIFIDLIGDPVS